MCCFARLVLYAVLLYAYYQLKWEAGGWDRTGCHRNGHRIFGTDEVFLRFSMVKYRYLGICIDCVALPCTYSIVRL